MATPTITLPTRTDLFFAAAKVGRATVAYDRDSKLYSVSAQGHSSRTTRRYTKAMDLAVGLA